VTAVAGDVVAARPWSSGTESPSRMTGVVLSYEPDLSVVAAPGWVYVWFPTLGGLTSDAAGAVQPILASKAEVTGSLDDWGVRKLRGFTLTLRDLVPNRIFTPAYRAALDVLSARGVTR
jgi:hypothetical protein